MRGLRKALYVSVDLCSRNNNDVMKSSFHGNSMTKAQCVFIVGCRLTWKHNSMVLSISSTENFMIILPDFIHSSWVSLTNSTFCWKDMSHLHPVSWLLHSQRLADLIWFTGESRMQWYLKVAGARAALRAWEIARKLHRWGWRNKYVQQEEFENKEIQQQAQYVNRQKFIFEDLADKDKNSIEMIMCFH